MVIVEWVSVFFIGKISGHLEWVSTTTRTFRLLIEPIKSTWISDHGCSGYVQCESTIRGGFFNASMQGTQLLTVFSMSESTLGQYTTLRAMAFIRLIPGCRECCCRKCSCLRTAFLSFVGITTRSANIRHSSMTDKESLRRLNCWRSPMRSRGHECLRNFLYHWVALYILGFSFYLHSCHRNCSDKISECALKIFLYFDGSDNGVVICNWYYLPTPPLGQDMTQGQFLSGVEQVWIQSFPSPRLVASTRLKNLVCPTIYP